MNGEEERQQPGQPVRAFAEERQDDAKQNVAVQNPNRGRRKNCVVLVVVIVIICLVTVVTIALLLLLKEKPNTDIKKASSASSNSTGSTGRPPVGNWSSWTNCSVTCGNGTRQRSRECPQSLNCNNSSVQVIPCLMPPCTEPAMWGQWSQWSQCSVTCANGVQARNRTCTGSDASKCQGSPLETRECNLPVCPRKDCLDLSLSGEKRNGIYTIDPDNQGPFQVYCDMTTDGGGWTVFQRRQDGSQNFNRNWIAYKTGFGNLSGEFWLGNDKIHRLTANHSTRLSVDLLAFSGGLRNATYEKFRVENETQNYTLTVESYSGNAGDSFSQQNRMKFTTKDRDNDKEGASNCAVGYQGGWWFKACLPVNLNGKYIGNTRNRHGIIWLTISTNLFNSLKYTQMRIRRHF